MDYQALAFTAKVGSRKQQTIDRATIGSAPEYQRRNIFGKYNLQDYPSLFQKPLDPSLLQHLFPLAYPALSDKNTRSSEREAFDRSGENLLPHAGDLSLMLSLISQ